MKTLACYSFILLFSVISRTFGAVRNPEGDASSSSNSDAYVFSTTFDEAVVKFRLNGVQEGNQNILPNNITRFLVTHSCKQENIAEISIAKDGRAEIFIEYKCHESDSNGCSRGVVIMLVIILLFIVGTFLYVRARTSRVNGEVRWRMWSIPQLPFVTAIGRNRSDSRSRSDMEHPNEKLYTDDNIPVVLSNTMLKPFTKSDKM